MEDGVARSPSRLCSRDGKICCYGDALSAIFLLAFVPCFLLFVFRFSFLFFSHLSQYVYLLRVPSSVQQQSATLSKYVFYIYSTCSFCLCHLYPTPSRFFFFSFLALFSQAAFSCCCALVPGFYVKTQQHCLHTHSYVPRSLQS